ncbi:hypothetical protein E2320_016353 [Naja naja]|nr:hypothetical protein E2320_016353 [Naja naja]
MSTRSLLSDTTLNLQEPLRYSSSHLVQAYSEAGMRLFHSILDDKSTPYKLIRFIIGKVVVVERYRKEKTLPQLDRIKFLVSPDISMSQFIFTLRTRLSLTATQAFYLLVNNQTLPCPSLTILEIYNDNKDEDGFLYMTYASQEMFGTGVSSEHQ